MEVVKAFTTNGLHTEIVIKGTVENPIFRASDIGEILKMSNIRSHIQHFDKTERDDVNSIDGIGRVQQVTFLTEKGLYKILFKSRKSIAEQFQNWVCDVVKELRISGTYSLQQQLEQTQQQLVESEQNFDSRLRKENELKKQEFILREFGSNSDVIYIVRVKTFENGTYIIKIGESQGGLVQRFTQHKQNYKDETILLDCFAVKCCLAFEQFIHKHDKVKTHQVTNLPNHEKEIELFLIGNSLSYETLIQIIQKHLPSYNEYTEKYVDGLKKQIEILTSIITNTISKQESTTIPSDFDMETFNAEENLRLENIPNNTIISSNTILNTVVENVSSFKQKQDSLEQTFDSLKQRQDLFEQKLNPPQQIKTMTNFQTPLVTLGPRLQKINPDTFQLEKVYESVAECLKEYNFRIKRPSIQKAVSENTIYHGYRWMYVDRDQDANLISGLAPTKKTRPQNCGYIAKLNHDKTEIVTVFLDRKTASVENGYSPSALDTSVKNFSISNGYYYKLYEECDDVLKDVFVEKYGEPIMYKDGVGQFNASNNELVKEFVCKFEVQKQLQISDKTIIKSITNNIPYNGYLYKLLGQKRKVGL